MCGRRLIDKHHLVLRAPPLGYRLCGRIAMWRWLTFVFVEPIRWLDVLFYKRDDQSGCHRNERASLWISIFTFSEADAAVALVLVLQLVLCRPRYLVYLKGCSCKSRCKSVSQMRHRRRPSAQQLNTTASGWRNTNAALPAVVLPSSRRVRSTATVPSIVSTFG